MDSEFAFIEAFCRLSDEAKGLETIASVSLDETEERIVVTSLDDGEVMVVSHGGDTWDTIKFIRRAAKRAADRKALEEIRASVAEREARLAAEAAKQAAKRPACRIWLVDGVGVWFHIHELISPEEAEALRGSGWLLASDCQQPNIPLAGGHDEGHGYGKFGDALSRARH